MRNPKELDRFVQKNEGQEIIFKENIQNDRNQIETVREKLAYDKMMHAQDK